MPKSLTHSISKMKAFSSMSYAKSIFAVVVCCTGGIGRMAFALDYSLTGFGSLGFAESDGRISYLRHVDQSGSFRADSLIGLQLEGQITPQIAATAQVVASADRDSDTGAAVGFRWAFLSLRPTNDWLFRIGRLRPPVLMKTQLEEVGVTYDQARLPVEVYSLSPVYDADGASVTKVWALGGAEVSMDWYLGLTRLKFRESRALEDDFKKSRANYIPERVRLTGVVWSLSSEQTLFKFGVHRVNIWADGGRPPLDGFDAVSIPGGFPIGGILFVPGKVIPRLDINVLTLGIDTTLGRWRLTSEYGRRDVRDSSIGIGSRGAYLTLSRPVGNWVPYVTHARLVSDKKTRDLFESLVDSPVPIAVQVPPMNLPAAFHLSLASQMFVYDQRSIIAGASYLLSSDSKLKFEVMRTKVGLASSLVDGSYSRKSFNILTVAYHFAF